MEVQEAIERKKASDFAPELWELFDEYVHGDIKRREFIERASKFAVGGVTGAMLWEMMRPHYAWAQQVPKNDARIKAEYVMYPSPNGNSANGQMRGLLARPATGTRLPAVIVVHENRGLNPYVEDVVRRLARRIQEAAPGQMVRRKLEIQRFPVRVEHGVNVAPPVRDRERQAV